jgi:hypothetical protein
MQDERLARERFGLSTRRCGTVSALRRERPERHGDGHKSYGRVAIPRGAEARLGLIRINVFRPVVLWLRLVINA